MLKYVIYDHFTERHERKWEQIWIRRPLQDERKPYPLMLVFAGYAQWMKGWEFVREKSDIFSIEMVCEGNASFTQENNSYLVNKGEVYLPRKDIYHRYTPGPSGRLLKRYITIDGIDLENILHYLNLWNKDHIVLKEPKKFEKHLKQFTDMLAMPYSDTIDRELSCMIYRLLLILSESIQVPLPPVIEKALAYIHRNLHTTISRKEICNYVGISMPHFNKVFSSYFHCSPIRYFINQKLHWTAHMLKTSSAPVKEIAYRAGFHDPLYFSAQFKKYFRVSPRKYRAMYG